MLPNRSPEHCGLTADRDAAFRWTFRGLGANPYPSNLHSTGTINSPLARRAELSGAPL